MVVLADYRRATFAYRCPRTAQTVQGWAADDPTKDVVMPMFSGHPRTQRGRRLVGTPEAGSKGDGRHT
jgi:hypothetical protein